MIGFDTGFGEVQLVRYTDGKFGIILPAGVPGVDEHVYRRITETRFDADQLHEIGTLLIAGSNKWQRILGEAMLKIVNRVSGL